VTSYDGLSQHSRAIPRHISTNLFLCSQSMPSVYLIYHSAVI